ncbi:MAG: hypothetical protein ACOX2L_05185 [Anaerolineae bacterium]|jgi:hypothetical protein
MTIGKIISASTHVDYVCQIHGAGETAATPLPADYSFGTFVTIDQRDGSSLVGLIVNTILMNPEFGNLGPRLSPEEDLAIFSPDYLAEQATLVAIVAIGARNADGTYSQGVPRVAADIDAGVNSMSDEEIAQFHHSGGRLALGYLSLLQGMASNPLISPLLQQLTLDLSTRFPEHAATLAVLRRNLAWRAAVLPAG